MADVRQMFEVGSPCHSAMIVAGELGAHSLPDLTAEAARQLACARLPNSTHPLGLMVGGHNYTHDGNNGHLQPQLPDGGQILGGVTLEGRISFEEGCINGAYNTFLLCCNCCGLAHKGQMALILALFRSYSDDEFPSGSPVLFGGAEDLLAEYKTQCARIFDVNGNPWTMTHARQAERAVAGGYYGHEHTPMYHGDSSCVTKVDHQDGSSSYERSVLCISRCGACPGIERAMGRTFTWHSKRTTGRKETPKFVFLFAMFGGGKANLEALHHCLVSLNSSKFLRRADVRAAASLFGFYNGQLKISDLARVLVDAVRDYRLTMFRDRYNNSSQELGQNDTTARHAGIAWPKCRRMFNA